MCKEPSFWPAYIASVGGAVIEISMAHFQREVGYRVYSSPKPKTPPALTPKLVTRKPQDPEALIPKPLQSSRPRGNRKPLNPCTATPCVYSWPYGLRLRFWLIIWFGEVLQICCQVLYGFIYYSRRVLEVSIYRDGTVGRRFCARGHTNRKLILGNFRGPIWVLI